MPRVHPRSSSRSSHRLIVSSPRFPSGGGDMEAGASDNCEYRKVERERLVDGRNDKQATRRHTRREKQDDERDDSRGNRMRRMRMRTPGEISKQAGWRHGTRRKTRRETGREARRARRRPRARIDTGKMAICFIMRRSHQLIAHHPSPRLSSRPSSRPAPRSIVIHRRPSPRPAYRCLGSSRPVVLSSCSLVAFYHRPVVAYPIHGSGSAAKGVGSGDGGRAFSMRRFPQLIIVRPIIRFSSSGAASDRFRPPSWRPRRVPHHLIRLIHLTRPIAPVPSWMAEGVRYFVQASNEAMASIPSRSISSRLIISSHPHHEASRPGVSSHASRPSSRTIHQGHQRWNGKDEASKRTRKTGKAGTRNGEQNGARAE